MNSVSFELTEIDIIVILNSLSFFLNEMTGEDNPKTKRLLSLYVNFSDNEEYADYYNCLLNLYRRLSLISNRKIYNIKNDIFLLGKKSIWLQKN